MISFVAVTDAACGNDDGNVDAGISDGGQTTDAGETPDGGMINCTTPTASLASLTTNIFNTAKCNTAGCHGPSFQGGLFLGTSDTQMIRTNLLADSFNFVGRTNFPKRVVANQPNQSYLLNRLSAVPMPAPRMPQGAVPLNDCEIQAITTWIQNGALDD